jgi:hypothetical protein
LIVEETGVAKYEGRVVQVWEVEEVVVTRRMNIRDVLEPTPQRMGIMISQA